MSASPDNFDSLEKLLRLKRYEQPPPRYFKDFSGRVVSRIEAGEGRGSWWERFGFDLRPAFAGAAGMLACGLVIYGVATADGEPDLGGFTSENSSRLLQGNLLLAGSGSSGNSTNPVTSYSTSIDRRIFGGEVLRTSFQMR
jgi:hypothetical protein